MEVVNYKEIFRIEKNNWWYKARRHLLDLILKSLAHDYDVALDVGCCTGSNLSVLKKYSKQVFGLDISAKAINFCKKLGYNELLKCDFLTCKLEQKFDLILCMDFLEHVDDIKAIKQIKRYLKKGGIFIFSVPAHNYLWNINDLISKHLRRYEKQELINLLDGFKILKISYWNFLMFFPFFVFCKIKFVKKRNNLTFIPQSLNPILYSIMKIENYIFMRYGLPQGTSIIGFCKKI